MADGSLTKAVDGNITKDEVYRAVPPDDFESMLELDRYNNRSTAFDKIISATHDHFWDPLSKDYIDFDEPFDMENEALLPEEMIGVLQTPYGKEMLADFAVAEIDKHFAGDRYGHLDRHEARRLAREQADYLWQQQYGRY